MNWMPLSEEGCFDIKTELDSQPVIKVIRKLWIRTIRGLPYANREATLCKTIHTLRNTKSGATD